MPQLIRYLDDLESRGIIRIIKATLDIRAKIASEYSPGDIERIGDGLVDMLGLLEKMSDPRIMAFLKKLVDIPFHVDLEKAGTISPFGLVSAGFNHAYPVTAHSRLSYLRMVNSGRAFGNWTYESVYATEI